MRSERRPRRATRPAWVCALLWVAACGHSPGGPEKTEPPPVPVSVVRAVKQTVPRAIKAIGSVESVHTVRVMPQVDGQIAALHFTEGQRVEKGQLLVSLDARPFEALLRQRQAALRRDEADLLQARAEARRRAALFEQGLISAEENEAAQTRVATLEATVQADRAAVEDARLQLEYCSIHSPVSGRAGQALVHPGNVVRKQETVLTVVQQISPVRVAFQIREQDLPAVRSEAAHHPLKVWADASEDGARRQIGELEFIDNAVDRSTGTILLKASFSNENEELWPGQFVPVELVVAEVADALVLPRAAIQVGQQGTYVFRLEGAERVRVAPVTIAFEHGERVVIENGVADGDLVVREGQFRLVDGARVAVRTPEPDLAGDPRTEHP